VVQKLDSGKLSEFDSLVYLFEAVGYLISIEEIPEQRRVELLTIALSPSLLRIESIMAVSDVSAIPHATIGELSDLISSIGAISKGYPDYDASEKGRANSNIWSQPFITTLKGILVVLARFNIHSSIREAVRFALQRMAGCMGPELLEFVPSFLSSGLLSSETAKEIIEFLPFINQMVYKFQVQSFDQAVNPQYPCDCMETTSRKNQFLPFPTTSRY
jgi:exportin-T